MLFSATQTTKVADLARISLRPGPLYINVDSGRETSTAEGLEQGYVVCESHMRFLLLFTFLRKNLKKKVIVFFSSCNSVKYYAELLNYIDVPVMDLHVSTVQHRAYSRITDLDNKYRASRSSRSVQTPSSSSVTLPPVFSCARTLPLVVSISPR